MKFLENYKDFIGKGVYNKVSELDSNWVIKTPLDKNETGLDTKYILSKFDSHIHTMKSHPEIFPKVKKLDRYRAAIEKLDTKNVKKEIEYLKNSLSDFIDFNSKYNNMLHKLFFKEECHSILNDIKGNDPILNKWYDFIIKLYNSDLFRELGRFSDKLDIHEDNFGIDKEGNIKLLDF